MMLPGSVHLRRTISFPDISSDEWVMVALLAMVVTVNMLALLLLG